MPPPPPMQPQHEHVVRIARLQPNADERTGRPHRMGDFEPRSRSGTPPEPLAVPDPRPLPVGPREPLVEPADLLQGLPPVGQVGGGPPRPLQPADVPLLSVGRRPEGIGTTIFPWPPPTSGPRPSRSAARSASQVADGTTSSSRNATHPAVARRHPRFRAAAGPIARPGDDLDPVRQLRSCSGEDRSRRSSTSSTCPGGGPGFRPEGVQQPPQAVPLMSARPRRSSWPG